jgi:hypothetical protein
MNTQSTHWQKGTHSIPHTVWKIANAGGLIVIVVSMFQIRVCGEESVHMHDVWKSLSHRHRDHFTNHDWIILGRQVQL